MNRINLNIYECRLYKLILDQRERLEFLTQQNINSLLDFITFNYSELEKEKKIEEQRILNVRKLKNINNEMINFKHCEKCLFQDNDNEKE